MVMTTQKFIPEVTWAQRTDKLFVTINVADARQESVELLPSVLKFSATSGADKSYEVAVEFYEDVVPEESKSLKTGQSYSFIIKKKTEGPYWPRLLKQEGKQYWLKTDFSKWRDEDEEQEDEAMPDQFGGMDFSQFGNQFGGMGAGAGMPNFEDSDDEELPEDEANEETQEEEKPSEEAQ